MVNALVKTVQELCFWNFSQNIRLHYHASTF